MSREIWLISDTHFNHSNIIGYSSRPYSSVREMDWDMVEKWNSVVKPQDKVYHLGDVYMKASSGYINNLFSSLNGKKRLILGNHDNGKDQNLLKNFEKILVLRDFKDFGIVLSHLPIHEGSIKKGRVNVHGHTHEKGSPPGPYKSVCVELTNYTPVNIEELRVKT